MTIDIIEVVRYGKKYLVTKKFLNLPVLPRARMIYVLLLFKTVRDSIGLFRPLEQVFRILKTHHSPIRSTLSLSSSRITCVTVLCAVRPSMAP